MKTPQEIFDIMMKNDAFSQWLQIEVIEIGLGFCTLKTKINKEMLNGFSIAHGGISYSLADSALAFSANSRGNKCVSIETSISHLKKVLEGDELTASCVEINKTNSIGLYRVEIKNIHNQLVAIFNGTVFISTETW